MSNKTFVFEHWPLTRNAEEILRKPVVNRLPPCRQCIGGRLLLNNVTGKRECPNCGYSEPETSDLPLIHGPHMTK